MHLLSARGLKKTYPGNSTPALAEFNFTVERGEIVGLLGPNGAGKTTAIGIMSTLLKPDQGQVFLNGRDLARSGYRGRKDIGLIPQKIALYPDLTARENLNYFGRMAGLKGSRLNTRVETCLDHVGLRTHARKRVGTFSGGMQRRANIAAGIIHAPDLLFLDEPTVGVDAQSRRMILDYLKSLRDDGLGMLYTTHYMEEAETLCDRVAIIDEGRIIDRGMPGELLDRRPECRNLGELFLSLTGKALRD
jgi:ABC-2 type transport system ATP-binding protein